MRRLCTTQKMERQNKKRKGEWQADGVGPLPQQVPPLRVSTMFDDLLAQPLAERLKRFDSLPEPTKLSVLYPQVDTTGLPEREPYPENWEKMVTGAMDVVRRQIEAEFANRQAPPPATTINTDSDESEDDDGLYEPDVVAAMTHGSSTSNTQQSSDERNQLLFLENLPRCLPIITYGFHLVDQQDDGYCFCPCGREPQKGSVVWRWLELCGIPSILSGSACSQKKTKTIQMSPRPFLQHLESKAHGCKFHWIFYEFLKELFRNFNGLAWPLQNVHIAFLNQGSDEWRKTLHAIKEKRKNDSQSNAV